MNSFIAIDFETANQHRSSICSVGLVFVENNVIVDRVYELIKPIPNFYMSSFTEIHGINYWDTLHAQTFDVFWSKIKSKIGDLPFIAHNKAFDEHCLIAVLTKYNMEIPKNKFYCTLKESRLKIPNLPNYKLNTVAKYCGYDLINHHNAIADADACAHIALNIFKL